jgi:predicted deacetylase
MRIDELDDTRFMEQLQRREELVDQLLADGFRQCDIHENGDTRFVKLGEFKTLRWNGLRAQYEVK